MTTIFNRKGMKEYRRQNRNNMPLAERLLWQELKGKKVNGYKFRRQYSIDRFIADFYCPKARLVIEVDGNTHNEDNQIYDSQRQNHFEVLGLTVLRFTNDEVYNDVDGVVKRIKQQLTNKVVPPSEGGIKGCV